VAFHAHERSLVQHYQGRPFVILGVNEDADLDTCRRSQARQHLDWPSAWDAGHAVAREWQVEGYPAVFLIGPDGEVRFGSRGAPDPEHLRGLIDGLLQALP
jgi:hypothetical protein